MSPRSQFKTDFWVLLALQVILAILVCIGVLSQVVHPATHGARAIGTLTVEHGPNSMRWLYTVFGTATALYGLAISVSEAHKGHKVLLVVLDYAALTYLFVWCEWFRERVFGLYPLASS